MAIEITETDYWHYMYLIHILHKLGVDCKLKLSAEQQLEPVNILGRLEPVEHIQNGTRYFIDTEDK